MKNIKIIILFFLFLSLTPMQARNKRPLMDKMYEHKWKVMLTQVKLTQEEIARVKPIFIEYEQAVWKIHKERINTIMDFKKSKNNGTIDYNSLNDKYINLEIRQAQLLRNYHLKLKEMLKPETLFNYYQAERMFKRKLLRDMPPPPDERD